HGRRGGRQLREHSRTPAVTPHSDEQGRHDMFKAMVLEEKEGKVSGSVQDMDDARLPPGDVTVAIDYSTLNYKDGMVLGGLGRLVRSYPHVPGIDFAGTVEASDTP